MGNCLSSFRQKREISVLFAGLDGAGKTTVVNKLAGLPINTISPTVGLNTLKIKKGSYDINVLDLGGEERIRDIWKNYLAEAFGVVFLVDSSDIPRLDETKKVLETLLNSKNVKGKPILIIANKQDKKNALTEDEVKAKMQLENFYKSDDGLYQILKEQLEQNGKNSQKLDGLRLFQIFESLKLLNQKKCNNQLISMILSSAVESSGKKNNDSLNCGIKWLLDSIENEFETLKSRVEMDTEERDLQLQEEKALRFERVKKRREERERLQKEQDTGDSSGLVIKSCDKEDSGDPHKIHVNRNLLEEAIRNCGKVKSDTSTLNGEPCSGHQHKIHVKKSLLEEVIRNKGENNCKKLATNDSQTISSTETTKDLNLCSSTENQEIISNCRPPISFVQFLNKCHSTSSTQRDTLEIHCDFESTNCTTTEGSTSQICSTEEATSNEVLVPVKEFPEGRKITPSEREILDKDQMMDDCFNQVDSKPSFGHCETTSLESNIQPNSHPTPRSSHPVDLIYCPDVCYGHPETDLDTIPVKDQSNLIEDPSNKDADVSDRKHYGRSGKRSKKRSLAERLLKSQSSVKQSVDEMNETAGGCVNRGFGNVIVDEQAAELPGSIIDDFVEVKSCESCRLNEAEEEIHQNISADLKPSSFDEGYCDDSKIQILDKEKKKKKKKRNKNKVKPLSDDLENQGILLPLKKPVSLPPLNLSSINRSFILNEDLQLSKDDIKGSTKEQVIVSSS